MPMSSTNKDNNSNNENGEGGNKGGSTLIKKLLFPSYTEAGSNHTFQAPPHGTGTIMNQHRPASSSPHANEHDEYEYQQEASPSRRQVFNPHDVEYDGSQIGGYAPQPLPLHQHQHDRPVVHKATVTAATPAKQEFDVSTSMETCSPDKEVDMSLLTFTGTSPAVQIMKEMHQTDHKYDDDGKATRKEFTPIRDEEDSSCGGGGPVTLGLDCDTTSYSEPFKTPNSPGLMSPPMVTRQSFHTNMNSTSAHEQDPEQIRNNTKSPSPVPSPVRKLCPTTLFQPGSTSDSDGEESQQETEEVVDPEDDGTDQDLSEKKTDPRTNSNPLNDDDDEGQFENVPIGNQHTYQDFASMKKPLNDQDDSEDSNSLVSEYGSDVGEFKMRLDDVETMAALEEGEEEDDEDEDEGEAIVQETYGRKMSGDSFVPASPKATTKTNVTTPATPSTPIASMSAAIRLIGTSITRCNQSSPTMSSVIHVQQSPSGLENVQPLDLSAFESGGGKSGGGKKPWLSPRFGPSKHVVGARDIQQPKLQFRSKGLASPFRLSSDNDEEYQSFERNSKPNTPSRKNLLTPLMQVRECLSFDPESGRPPYANMTVNTSPPTSPLRTHLRRVRSLDANSDCLSETSSNFLGRKANGHPQSEGRKSNGATQPGGRIFSGLSAASTGAAFRNNGASIIQREDHPFRRKEVGHRRGHSNDSLDLSTPNGKANNSMILGSPQRVVDIEREDALDILALLVERSIAFHENTDQIDTMESLPRIGTDVETNDRDKKVESGSSEPPQTTEKIDTCIAALKKISLLHSEKDNDEDFSCTHETRLKVLDDLKHSHTYALEMKRAALSASTWLKAIGRQTESKDNSYGVLKIDVNSSIQNKSNLIGDVNGESVRVMLSTVQKRLEEKEELTKQLDKELSFCRQEIGRLKSTNRSDFVSPNKSIFDEDADDDTSSCDSSIEDNGENDEETAKDKTSSRADDSDSNSTALDVKKENILLKIQLKEAQRRITNLKNVGPDVESSSVDQQTQDEKEANEAIIVSNSENEIDEKEGNPGDDSSDTDISFDDEHSSDVNSIFFDEEIRSELDKYIKELRFEDERRAAIEERGNHTVSQKSSDDKMINVRMLDAENFVTEWDSCTLPPPPDHKLNSPIVSSLLSQWTSEKSTQDALLSWVDRVMKDSDISSIPPLKLSNLNHQVRDGFTMHILPFLLHRQDIHVDVKSRAQRCTSYDMVVSVNEIGPKARSKSMSEGRHHHKKDHTRFNPQDMVFSTSGRGNKFGKVNIDYATEASSVTHSAVTTFVCNQQHQDNDNHIPKMPLETDVKEKVPAKSHHPGIVAGAINAVGDLFSRRMNVNDSTRQSSSITTPKPQSTNISTVSSPVISESHDDDGDQPYHRVIAAPPGRIGITFIQYRGHALVGDVYEDSPLKGWIFPSDILIAIDECPVSGMRVPDIVKLLTARKSNQRALRIISTHEMNDITCTSSSGALMDG